MNLNKLLKKQNETPYKKEVFTGKVRFIWNGKIKAGKVFGKPFRHTFVDTELTYNINCSGTVYMVKESHIEAIK